MYGLAAIQQANGWALAGACAFNVLIGLTVLSFLISLIPRITGLLETKSNPPIAPAGKDSVQKPIVPETLREDVTADATIYE